MTPITQTPTTKDFITGALLAMTTMTIWAGWNVVSRLGIAAGPGEQLAGADIVFLRFAVAGILCLYLFFKHWSYYKTIPVYFLLLMICGAGAPYVYMAGLGFETAPASHGVLIPGAMLVWVALASHFWLKEEINAFRIIGYVLIAATLIYRLISHEQGDYLYSDAMFLIASVLWASYTVINKRTGITPVGALALINVGSLVGYCIPYVIMHGDGLADLPMQPALIQMVYQGLCVSFLAFICYNKAIVLIGPSRASAFAAAIPILTVLISMPALGEIPETEDWWFVGLLTISVLFATGSLRRIFKL